MEALWGDHHYGKKMGLTLKDLATSLPSTAKPGQQMSVTAVRDCLKILSGLSLILVDYSVSHGKGRPSEVVRIDVEKVITWPTTAAIVLRLFTRKNLMCQRDEFTKDVMS